MYPGARILSLPFSADPPERSEHMAEQSTSNPESEQLVARPDPLPPPAFPPGDRRYRIHRPRAPGATNGEDRGGLPSDAFSAPDAPIRRIEKPGGPGTLGASERPASARTADAVAGLLEELAREVRRKRVGRLLWKPGASPLEGALRGLLSGFLREEAGETPGE